MSIALTLCILILALISFALEWFPVDFTALLVAILLMVFGIVTPEEGVSGFSNPATITVMAMFILSAGISRTGAIQIVGDWLLKWGGNTSQQQTFVMSGFVGSITAVINNTAVVAIFLPIIEEWCKTQKIPVSRMLMPLSFATILGGTITLIGTSTNLLASSISEQLGYGTFSLFQFTEAGIIKFGIGIIYLTFASSWLLPNRNPTNNGNSYEQSYQLKDYVSELVISPRSNLIKQTLRSSEIQRKFDIDVLEIIRDGIHFSQPLADKVLKAGDILLVRGTKEEILKIRDEKGLDILPAIKFKDDNVASQLTDNEEGIAEILILSNSRLVGSNLKDLRFRQRYNATVLAIRRGEEVLRDRLGQVPLRFGDLLLVQGPRESLSGFQTTRELLVIEQGNREGLRLEKASIAVAIVFGVIISAALDLMPILVSALVGVVLMVLTGCLKPGEIYGAIRWDVIFLLAGLIPMGIAMEKSGATTWLADKIIIVGNNFSGFWVLIFFYFVTTILTEILSNNASVILMIPIAVKVAEALTINPFAIMFTVTFAASNSFMTPIGYQTNTMVYSPGGYRFRDFTRFGAPLSLIQGIITPFLVIWLYGL
ncbi:SLC13 family permease [Dactylococcopsis salina]|uniref:Di-/tricarboxylate transporter n=1 Tax=Dactylococcopsis salina (strain PCC 8305) TaxID=13035 RepID=K9YSH7_DACS8|nr:SLC13 family permease [Dactylococcopsis salina]AFZ49285.1 di-/tricarboxylate transporter [Dactylococcopsis salina PCC 8305]